jgi:hypothetical protein
MAAHTNRKDVVYVPVSVDAQLKQEVALHLKLSDSVVFTANGTEEFDTNDSKT